MAFGNISAFAHQRVTIGTEMALNITITGNPDHAYIEGLLEGFYTNWKNPTLEVRGVAMRLINNVPFTVKALKGSEAPLTRSGLFSVVPAAPVITNPGRQKFIRGIENSFVVKVSNSPSKVRAVGPWFGMKADPDPDGIRISGIVPEVLHAVPSAAQRIRVTAETGELTDTVEIGFDFLNSFIYGTANQDDFYRLALNDSDQSASSDLDFATNHGQIRYLASDADYIYYGSIDSNGRYVGSQVVVPRQAVFRVPRNTGNDQSVTGTLVKDFNVNGGGIAIDGNDGYRAEGSSSAGRIRVFNKSSGSTIRRFTIDVNQYLRGLAIDGDDLIVLIVRSGVAGQHLRWYDKNTANNRRANRTRELTLPNPNVRYADKQYEDITVFDGKIFVTNHTAKTITTIDIETGVVLETYTLLSSLRGMYGITIQVA